VKNSGTVKTAFSLLLKEEDAKRYATSSSRSVGFFVGARQNITV
jgi:hypothetical protein